MIASIGNEGCKAPPITISQSQIEAAFATGRTFRLFMDSTSQPVNVGHTGGPNTYDFRNLSFVPYDSVRMLAISEIPQLAARFPPNSLTSDEEANTMHPVFSFSNGGFNRHGRARIVPDTEWYQHIVPPDEWLRFPLRFNTEYSQTNTIVVNTTYVTGTPTRTSADTMSVTRYIDGYGTLLLPGGLAFQCLRMRLVASSPKTSKGFHFWTREGAVILIESYTSQPDTGFVTRGFVAYFSPQTQIPSTRD
jgi:hypothetical protein